jgi:hypothetical protein
MSFIKINVSILLLFILTCCSSTEALIINEIDTMPNEIEGCCCYLSFDNSSFNQQRHIFASNNDSVAFIEINDKLTKIRKSHAKNEPFTFKNHDLVEYYENENYSVTIDAHFEDSSRYDAWNFSGQMTVTDTLENKTTVNFVGTCGC